MQRFTPNTVIQNRFLLKQELSFEQQTGQQVWAVQDRQTGQALIARLHADGRVEWFSDNRLSVVTPLPGPAVRPAPISAVQPTAKPVQAPLPNTARPPAPASMGKRAGTFLGIMLLLGAVIAGYFYRKPLLAYARLWSSNVTKTAAINPADTTTQAAAPTNAGTVAGLNSSGTLPTWEAATSSPAPAEPKASATGSPATGATPTPAASPITVSQALRVLNALKQIPAQKHPAIFADARLAFETLRQTPGRERTIDSLYTVCVGRGAQSFLAHQQNGDPASKKYAVEWYQTAYALKPTPDLQSRISRLINGVPKASARQAVPARKSRTHESLFLKDPEVNN